MLELYLEILAARRSLARLRDEDVDESDEDEAGRLGRLVALRQAEGRLRRAEEAVYRRLAAPVRHALRACGADEGLKQDLLQKICFQILKSGTLEGLLATEEGQARAWTWRVVRSKRATACAKAGNLPGTLEAPELVPEDGAHLGSTPGPGRDLREAILDCALDGALAVVRGGPEVPEQIDSAWRAWQVPRTEAGVRRAVSVYRRVSLGGEDLVAVAADLGITVHAASRDRGRGKRALRLGAFMAVYARCCDVLTRSRLATLLGDRVPFALETS